MTELLAVDQAVRRKALAVLREGRLTVVSARSGSTTNVPFELVAAVRSSRGTTTYAVDLADGEWACTCRDQVRPCGHIFAAQLITGQAS